MSSIEGGSVPQIDLLEAGKKCPPGKTRGASGRCRRKICRGSKIRSPTTKLCRQPKKAGSKRKSAPSSARRRQPKSHKMAGGQDAPIEAGMYQGRRMYGGAVEGGNAADLSDFLEAGKKKACATGKTRDAKTGACRRKLCRGSKVRSPTTKRCRQPKKAGSKRKSAPSSARRRYPKSHKMAGGLVGGAAVEPVLTAGALEEAFQAGLQAGRGF